MKVTCKLQRSVLQHVQAFRAADACYCYLQLTEHGEASFAVHDYMQMLVVEWRTPKRKQSYRWNISADGLRTALKHLRKDVLHFEATLSLVRLGDGMKWCPLPLNPSDPTDIWPVLRYSRSVHNTYDMNADRLSSMLRTFAKMGCERTTLQDSTEREPLTLLGQHNQYKVTGLMMPKVHAIEKDEARRIRQQAVRLANDWDLASLLGSETPGARSVERLLQLCSIPLVQHFIKGFPHADTEH